MVWPPWSNMATYVNSCVVGIQRGIPGFEWDCRITFKPVPCCSSSLWSWNLDARSWTGYMNAPPRPQVFTSLPVMSFFDKWQIKNLQFIRFVNYYYSCHALPGRCKWGSHLWKIWKCIWKSLQLGFFLWPWSIPNWQDSAGNLSQNAMGYSLDPFSLINCCLIV